jgi:uncharacterized protein
MGKVIFWIVVVFVVLLGLRLANVGAAKRRARGPGTAKGAAPGDTMVRCASCGVYLPKADALPAPGGYLCGDPGCAPRR